MDACKEISYEVIHNQYKNHVHAALNTSTNFSIQQSRHDYACYHSRNEFEPCDSIFTDSESIAPSRKPFDASYLSIMDLGPT